MDKQFNTNVYTSHLEVTRLSGEIEEKVVGSDL